VQRAEMTLQKTPEKQHEKIFKNGNFPFLRGARLSANRATPPCQTPKNENYF
jgi:hypothetical protein